MEATSQQIWPEGTAGRRGWGKGGVAAEHLCLKEVNQGEVPLLFVSSELGRQQQRGNAWCPVVED